jgi:DNA-binding NarL/FixJ family response regulator
VLIVDDDAAFAASLRAYLADLDEIDVIGVAGDGGDAIDLALIHHPDVVLMDAKMPLVGGLDATAHLNAIRATSRVVVMSGDTSGDGGEAARVGAAAYLPKSSLHDHVVRVIAEVSRSRR